MIGSQRTLRCSGVVDVDRKRFNESIVEDIDARSCQLRRKRNSDGMNGESTSVSGEESQEPESPDHSPTCQR